MKVIYGTLIFFFYFIKYPVVIFVPVSYFSLDYPNNSIMNVLWCISLILIFKDWFFPHEKPQNCKGIQK
jgi:hypothetical protein